MLESNVLVLNRLFLAVNVTTVRKALILLYKGYARAVLQDYSTYDWEEWCDIPVDAQDECLRTPNLRLAVPRVVQLLQFDRVPPQTVRLTRNNIFLRDGNRCQYCGDSYPTRELNVDHVTPTSRGGKTVWENVVCCCLDCNELKGDRLPGELGMRLVRAPRRPRWNPLLKMAVTDGAHETWKSFLDLAYWNVELREE
jgi:5-methylcytosine-specific restriction endonuclease McrA